MPVAASAVHPLAEGRNEDAGDHSPPGRTARVPTDGGRDSNARWTVRPQRSRARDRGTACDQSKRASWTCPSPYSVRKLPTNGGKCRTTQSASPHREPASRVETGAHPAYRRLLAMQKVEGSNPFSRFPGSGFRKPQLASWRPSSLRSSGRISRPGTHWVPKSSRPEWVARASWLVQPSTPRASQPPLHPCRGPADRRAS